MSAISGKGTSLFTHATGIKVMAANGPVSFQAHTDRLNISADQSVTIQSVNDEITINANDKITLYAGNASITLDGPNITFTCPGKCSVKGVNHDFAGAASGPAILPNLPAGTTEIPPTELPIRLAYHDGEPVQGASYKAVLSDGTVREGRLDAAGFTNLGGLSSSVAAEITFGPDIRAYQKFKTPLNPESDLDDWMKP